MIEQERMRSGRMWLGTGWSPDLVVQCGALSLPPDSSQGSEHQAAVGRRWGEGSPLSSPSCLAQGASEPLGQPCRAHSVLPLSLPGPCATFRYGPASCQGAQRSLRGRGWGWQAAGHGHSGWGGAAAAGRAGGTAPHPGAPPAGACAWSPAEA